MSIDTLRHYLRCLFSALEHTHSRGILHRDVKPANFLFNPSKNHGTLCDFGLAEPFNPSEWQGRCLHSLPSSQMGFPHGKLLPRPKGVWQQVQDWHNKWLGLSDEEKASMNAKTPWLPMFDYEEGELIDKDEAAADFYNAWEPVNLDRPKKASRVGYLKPEQEKRPQIRANRAGTRGFRAPEVLLKCPDQTVCKHMPFSDVHNRPINKLTFAANQPSISGLSVSLSCASSPGGFRSSTPTMMSRLSWRLAPSLARKRWKFAPLCTVSPQCHLTLDVGRTKVNLQIAPLTPTFRRWWIPSSPRCTNSSFHSTRPSLMRIGQSLPLNRRHKVSLGIRHLNRSSRWSTSCASV